MVALFFMRINNASYRQITNEYTYAFLSFMHDTMMFDKHWYVYEIYSNILEFRVCHKPDITIFVSLD